ncbi:hypothetical protein [Synechococcus sp. PCC 7336]|uniref:hypothetical protein n=1 Tax=Synechococcus sp. PCC 7336 TaxID=195250 RepID=UPI00034CED45|nr:hypothetical protein [Synechococcus sp. PCC 7336]
MTVMTNGGDIIITVKEAVTRAYKHFQGLQELLGGPLENIRLEEVEFLEDSLVWRVTLGFDRTLNRPLIGDSVVREYKVFEVDARSGFVQGMKIRQV